MEAMIYALVDATGTVYVKDGGVSYTDVAKAHGVDERVCDGYRFDLVLRRLLQDRGSFATRRAARMYFNRHFGSPERLMVAAKEGRLPKHALASLLPDADHRTYLDACSAVERRCTEACAAGDPCLESGCSMEPDEACLQPLVRAEVEYHRACAVEWLKRFANPRDRIDVWQR